MISCPHVEKIKYQAALDSYGVIIKYALLRKHEQESVIGHGNKVDSGCRRCKDTMGRLFTCFECVFFGCYNGGHIQDHLRENNHQFAVNLEDFCLYCVVCDDYVHDVAFDDVVQKCIIHQRQSICPKDYSELAQASDKIGEQISSHSSVIGANSIEQTCAGLRGMYNLGNTCFISSVLQTLIHNPMMSAYFLSDAHDPYSCVLKKKGGVCFGCEFTQLFSKFFSGDTKPYIPHHFLYSMWIFAEHLAGYAQQDAHEFFISLLNGIHGHCDGQIGDCRCIVHLLFSGMLQSDVSCMNCGYVSTTCEPFFDISLEIKQSRLSTSVPSTLSAISPSTSHIGITLNDCLYRFTHPEKLDSGGFKCSHCTSYQESTKQLSLNRLPSVFSFHLKRFEHAASTTKIDGFIEFPLTINMTPFLSQYRKTDFNAIPENPRNDYDLYAVIIHKGSMETGHYVSYVQYKNDWYRLDDAVVTRASVVEVLQSNAYMLFYMKKILEYAA